MPKGKPKAQPAAAELRATLETLHQERDLCRPHLRRLLAAGQDTTALRTSVIALDRRIADVCTVLAALATEREREEATITSEDADRLATDALHRIKAALAGLQPPQHPTIQEFKL